MVKSLLVKNDLLDIESYKEVYDVRLDLYNIDYLVFIFFVECKVDLSVIIDILVFENNNVFE